MEIEYEFGFCQSSAFIQSFRKNTETICLPSALIPSMTNGTAENVLMTLFSHLEQNFTRKAEYFAGTIIATL